MNNLINNKVWFFIYTDYGYCYISSGMVAEIKDDKYGGFDVTIFRGEHEFVRRGWEIYSTRESALEVSSFLNGVKC